MGLPKSPSEALHYRWSSERQFQRWVANELLLLHRRFDASIAPPSHDPPRVVEIPDKVELPEGVSLYDSDPDGLEA